MNRRLELRGVVQEFIILHVICCPGIAIMCAGSSLVVLQHREQTGSINNSTSMMIHIYYPGGSTSVFRGVYTLVIKIPLKHWFQAKKAPFVFVFKKLTFFS